VDYEFQIRLAEKELAHLREMQAIMRSHQDAHDQSLSVIGSRLDRIEDNLEKVTALQAVTEQKLQGLIDLLVREHRNGH
jgi:septation ring formation regulator EzrA